MSNQQNEHPDSTSDEIAAFAKKMRVMRQDAGLSQEFMAIEIMYDQSQLSKVERGTEKLSKRLYRLSRSFFEQQGVDVSSYLK